MRYIILAFLVMSTIFLSGCRFSLIEGGFYKKDSNSYYKLGSYSFDLFNDNAENNYYDKQEVEEDIKRKDFIGGIYITKKF